jgi:hypothetical protein
MSIHRNIEIENADPSKHRDRNGLVQSKVIVIKSNSPLEHRAQKCARFCARTMLYAFDSGAFCRPSGDST